MQIFASLPFGVIRRLVNFSGANDGFRESRQIEIHYILSLS